VKKKHATIPVFVPHYACPNDCVFCDQKKISGAQSPPEDLEEFLFSAAAGLSEKFTEADIAFFGGSFTGIDENLMRYYLAAAKKTREKYPRITGIRLSTRPDFISEHILDVLEEYGVTAIELGAQSMDDGVLSLSERGHTAADTARAAKMIKSRGFSLVLQTMTGLPGDSEKKDIETAKKVAALMPDAVRIYPCVVLSGTKLERMAKEGKYKPQTVEEAVKICAGLIEFYEKNGIDVLRVGLHSSDLTKNGSVVGGAFHPAFGELCESEIIYRRMREKIVKNGVLGGVFATAVPKTDISKTVGQKRENIQRLEKEFDIKIRITYKE
jgi:histone acetyltransferase (RNA polymerase elongator complex component)